MTKYDLVREENQIAYMIERLKENIGSNTLDNKSNIPHFKNIFIPNIIASKQGNIFKIIPNDSVEPTKNSS